MTAMAFAGCKNAGTEQQSELIRYNQIGYYPSQEKVIVVEGASPDDEYTITDTQTKEEIWRGKASRTATSPWSGKERAVVDFTSVSKPGKYTISSPSGKVEIEIKDNALKTLADAAAKAYYYQRTGVAIEEQYAGVWHRPAGHPDTKVYIHESAASKSRPAGTEISSPYGWYDAGDYNKYIVNSAYSVSMMLQVYAQCPEYFAKQNLNIPESKNATPDLIDELYFNLKWMMTMQDPEDGGVYHKLTTPNFEAFVMPSECKQKRYVVAKSVTATLDFAALMAQVARNSDIWEKDYKGFAEQARKAAEKAYKWALANQSQTYRQDELNKKFKPEVNTGTYGDEHIDDERFWAATEMFLLTCKDEYKKDMIKFAPKHFTLPTWGNVASLGVYELLTHTPSEGCKDEVQLFENQKAQFIKYLDSQLEKVPTSCFNTSFGNSDKDFFWGCLSEGFANEGIAMMFGYKCTGDAKYSTNAVRNADYIFGINPLSYCYVTGFGTKSPMHPHMRLSAADGIEAPIPGFLVGGPNAGQHDKEYVKYTTDIADECYMDVEGSYAQNEIAINWNSTLVALTSWIDATLGKEK